MFKFSNKTTLKAKQLQWIKFNSILSELICALDSFWKMAHNMRGLIFIRFEYLSAWAPNFSFNNGLNHFKQANNDKGPKDHGSFYDILTFP
jgi:hypothetical protein